MRQRYRKQMNETIRSIMMNDASDRRAMFYDIDSKYPNKFVNTVFKLLTIYFAKKKSPISIAIIFLAGLFSFGNLFNPLWELLTKIMVPDEWPIKSSLLDFFVRSYSALDYTIIILGFIIVLCALIVHVLTIYFSYKNKQECARQLALFGFYPTSKWFTDNNRNMIAQLGERYSQRINFTVLKLIPVYQSIVEEEDWKEDFLDLLQKVVDDIKKLYEAHTNEFRNIEANINIFIDEFNEGSIQHEDVSKKISALLLATEQHLFTLGIHFSHFKISDIQKTIDNLSAFAMQAHIERTPLCHITGDAGMGKSHLIADLISQRQDKGKHSVLLLGAHFVMSDKTPQQQIEEMLDITCGFKKWLASLNTFGEYRNERIYIFIDGINEGRGETIWRNSIREFESEVMSYPWLGLVISARTFSGYNFLIQEGHESAFVFKHTGFAEVQEEAVDFFLKKYNIPQIASETIGRMIANPLFLKTYCEAYDGIMQIHTLVDIIKAYITKRDNEIKDKLLLSKSVNYASQAMRSFADLCIRNSKSLWIYQKYADYYSELCKILPNGVSTDSYIDALIESGLLLAFHLPNEDTPRLHFNFELVGGYLLADALLDSNQYVLEDVCWDSLVRVPFAVLYPYHNNGQEILSAYHSNLSDEDLEKWFSDSLSQRIEISTDAISYLKKLVANRNYNVFSMLPLVALKDAKDLFTDFNNWLKPLTMAERDAVWTVTISMERTSGECYSFAEKIFHLSRERIANLNSIQLYQACVMLVWMLSLACPPARNMATKALVKIFMEHPRQMIETLREFDNVNDPYVRQRIYAAILGGVLRSEDSELFPVLAVEIYNRIFNQEFVPSDILLRDYARNTIDFIIQKHDISAINISKIIPPYNSEPLPKAFPTSGEIIVNYRPVHNGSSFSDEEFASNAIINSMTTEYSSHGIYGDFGRYTFGSAVNNWNISDEGASNYAIMLIFSKYGYDPIKFGWFDSKAGSGRGRDVSIERIGKKYQWIAFYEILGQIADQYEAINKYSGDPKKYYGTWHPNVRDIDPTTDFVSHDEEFKRHATLPKLNWLPKFKISFTIKDKDNWLFSQEGLKFKYFFDRIQYKDSKGEKWLSLYTFNDYKESKSILTKSADDKSGFWIFAQSYDVPANKVGDVEAYIRIHGNQGRSLPEQMNYTHELFQKDYYHTASYREFMAVKKSYDYQPFDPFLMREESENDCQIEYAYLYTSPLEGRTCFRLSETIFTALDLKDGEREGEYVDATGRIAAMDVGVNYNSSSLLLIRENKLKEYLNTTGRQIIWPLVSEKSLPHQIGIQFGGYLSWNGKRWDGLLQQYDLKGEITKSIPLHFSVTYHLIEIKEKILSVWHKFKSLFCKNNTELDEDDFFEYMVSKDREESKRFPSE